MKTRRGAKKTDEGDQKLPAKKIKKNSSAAKKKRRTSSHAIISNFTTITTQCAVGTSNFSLWNVSERPSEMPPKCAVFKPIKPKYVQHVKDVGEELKWPCVDGKDPSTDDDKVFVDAAENHLADDKLVQEGLDIAGITALEVSFPLVPQKQAIQTAPPPSKEDEDQRIGSVLPQKMPAMQTAPPPNKEDELDELVQRIGSLLPQQLSQNPVLFVKITQTCFHEFMKKVSESKPNLLLHLCQATMVCIEFYQATMV